MFVVGLKLGEKTGEKRGWWKRIRNEVFEFVRVSLLCCFWPARSANKALIARPAVCAATWAIRFHFHFHFCFCFRFNFRLQSQVTKCRQNGSSSLSCWLRQTGQETNFGQLKRDKSGGQLYCLQANDALVEAFHSQRVANKGGSRANKLQTKGPFDSDLGIRFDQLANWLARQPAPNDRPLPPELWRFVMFYLISFAWSLIASERDCLCARGGGQPFAAPSRLSAATTMDDKECRLKRLLCHRLSAPERCAGF